MDKSKAQPSVPLDPSRFLRTPAQPRARAAQLRKNPSPEAQHVAQGLEIVAKLIEGELRRAAESRRSETIRRLLEQALG
jgi:hypothetical protein